MTALPDATERPRFCGALWNLGFRPLYLCAGAFATLALGLWTARVAGWSGGGSYLAHPYWHAHEMIFGYALAVIAGFLFTAVRNWTGLPTPAGATLAATVALWLAARLLLATPWPFASLAADLAFVMAVAAGIGVPLVRSGNRRNYFFIGLLLLLGGANLAFHLAMAGALALDVRGVLQVALDVLAFIMALMAGRVVPMFTANALRGVRPLQRAWLERAAPAVLAALVVADLVAPAAAAALAGAAAVIHAWRLRLWQPQATHGTPILWVLHVAYAWIVVYLGLRALTGVGFAPARIATHALTVGALGGLTLGMMTRTARGHTGRPLVAGRAEVACYVLINLAAIARVGGPLALPAHAQAAIVLSGILATAAFAVFTLRFAPILTASRADGRPG